MAKLVRPNANLLRERLPPLYDNGTFAGELAEFFFKHAHPRKGVLFGIWYNTCRLRA
jgi:hypothetical protein